MSTAWVFQRQQLQAALERFVADGPADLRAQRQEEADGTLMALDSDAFKKLRVEHQAAPGDARLDVVGVAGCKASVETKVPQ